MPSPRAVKLGRPKIDSATERKVRKQLARGVGILKVAKSLGIGTGTVQRISKERTLRLGGAEQSPQLAGPPGRGDCGVLKIIHALSPINLSKNGSAA